MSVDFAKEIEKEAKERIRDAEQVFKGIGRRK